MPELTCTLLSDGSSDRALIPILNWLFSQNRLASPVHIEWADLRSLRRPPRSLAERIERALDLFPADILFIHRDAEGASPDRRREEIAEALKVVSPGADNVRAIMVIPVRMMEAWLLFDELAIRRAAGSPTGRVSLDLPRLANCEGLADPKHVLHDRLRRATGRAGRHLNRFNVDVAVHRVADLIDDYSPILALPAFSKLHDDLRQTIVDNGWAA